jgi:hypothetical protein
LERLNGPSEVRERVKAYLVVTGTAFGLIVAAHVLRFFSEGSHLLTDPWFLLLTAIAIALFLWAMVLLRRLQRKA